MNIASILPDPSLRRQIWRFALIGFANVGVDLALYASFMALGVGIVVSKGVSYIVCVIIAFLSNKYWTFEHRDGGFGAIVPFAILYSASLLLNVTVNSVIAYLTDHTSAGLVLAFVTAVGSSAVLNFLGMRYLFRSSTSGAANIPPVRKAQT